ncbi:MAG TPA: hypothetical protein VGK26_11740 [Thermoanaerobaculia bacterium]
MKRFGRAVRLVAIIALLLLTAYTGIADGLDTLRSASGPLERVAAASQLAYGALAIASLLASLILRRWVVPLLVLWGAVLTLTGGLAPVVWGEQNALVGLLAGLCTAGIAALALWGCRRHNVELADRKRLQRNAA